MTSLNPLLRVGFQIEEVLGEHLGLHAAAARARVVELLAEVGIPEPAARAESYPHHLSGGMRQRVMIAIAMACAPRLLIADEPTTALDVTIQAQILALMRRLRAERGGGILLITHDMGVIAQMADRVAVMYAGQVVETAPLRAVLTRPAHPYAKLLLAAMPTTRRKVASLPVIPGQMPAPGSIAQGCRFRARCPAAIARCAEEAPVLAPLEADRAVRCWVPQ
jgi:oligopeptide/dipeptide ABC transporter ATP-binding protein